jgi:hypothetical protein
MVAFMGVDMQELERTRSPMIDIDVSFTLVSGAAALQTARSLTYGRMAGGSGSIDAA